jgi:hypothetical protein
VGQCFDTLLDSVALYMYRGTSTDLFLYCLHIFCNDLIIRSSVFFIKQSNFDLFFKKTAEKPSIIDISVPILSAVVGVFVSKGLPRENCCQKGVEELSRKWTVSLALRSGYEVAVI